MYEISGLQRRIETLEYELRAALGRLDRLETMMREEDRKVSSLERSFEKDHAVLEHDHALLEKRESRQHCVPVGL